MFSQEINANCRQLIVDHLQWCQQVVEKSYPTPCIFGDLLGCLPPGSFNPMDPFHKKLIQIDRAPFLPKQHCYSCNRLCPLFGVASSSDLEVAGLPCTDASNAGQRRFENGPSGAVFIAHAKQHIEQKTPIIVLENVQDECGREQILFYGWSTYPPNVSPQKKGLITGNLRAD